MNNSFLYKSYWHIQSLSSKDWLLLRSEAAFHNVSLYVLTKKKSHFSGLCVVYSNTFSNHYHLINRFNQITNKKMSLLIYQKGKKIYGNLYSLNPHTRPSIGDFIMTSKQSIEQCVSCIISPINTMCFVLKSIKK